MPENRVRCKDRVIPVTVLRGTRTRSVLFLPDLVGKRAVTDIILNKMLHSNVGLGTVEISSGGLCFLALRSVKNPSDLRRIQSRYNKKRRKIIIFFLAAERKL